MQRGGCNPDITVTDLIDYDFLETGIKTSRRARNEFCPFNECHPRGLEMLAIWKAGCLDAGPNLVRIKFDEFVHYPRARLCAEILEYGKQGFPRMVLLTIAIG